MPTFLDEMETPNTAYVVSMWDATQLREFLLERGKLLWAKEKLDNENKGKPFSSKISQSHHELFIPDVGHFDKLALGHSPLRPHIN